MEKYFKICPKCGSINVKIPHAGMDIKMTMKDECADCGKIGNFPEVKASAIKKFREKCKQH
jgi:hypothetical protein